MDATIRTTTASPEQGSAFAWQVHGALEAWGARVDRKAGMLLAHQGGGFLLGVTALPSHGSATIMIALVLLLTAMCATAAAALPVLGSAQRLARESTTNLVYFGHLRTWQPTALAAEIAQVTAHAETLMLARQLVVLSRMNWRKHRLVQASWAITLPAMCLGAAAVVLH